MNDDDDIVTDEETSSTSPPPSPSLESHNSRNGRFFKSIVEASVGAMRNPPQLGTQLDWQFYKLWYPGFQHELSLHEQEGFSILSRKSVVLKMSETMVLNGPRSRMPLDDDGRMEYHLLKVVSVGELGLSHHSSESAILMLEVTEYRCYTDLLDVDRRNAQADKIWKLYVSKSELRDVIYRIVKMDDVLVVWGAYRYDDDEGSSEETSLHLQPYRCCGPVTVICFSKNDEQTISEKRKLEFETFGKNITFAFCNNLGTSTYLLVEPQNPEMQRFIETCKRIQQIRLASRSKQVRNKLPRDEPLPGGFFPETSDIVQDNIREDWDLEQLGNESSIINADESIDKDKDGELIVCSQSSPATPGSNADEDMEEEEQLNDNNVVSLKGKRKRSDTFSSRCSKSPRIDPEGSYSEPVVIPESDDIISDDDARSNSCEPGSVSGTERSVDDFDEVPAANVQEAVESKSESARKGDSENPHPRSQNYEKFGGTQELEVSCSVESDLCSSRDDKSGSQVEGIDDGTHEQSISDPLIQIGDRPSSAVQASTKETNEEPNSDSATAASEPSQKVLEQSDILNLLNELDYCSSQEVAHGQRMTNLSQSEESKPQDLDSPPTESLQKLFAEELGSSDDSSGFPFKVEGELGDDDYEMVSFKKLSDLAGVDNVNIKCTIVDMFEADEAQDIGYIAVEDGTVPNINIQASSMQFEPNINSQAFSQFSQSVSGLKGCVIKVHNFSHLQVRVVVGSQYALYSIEVKQLTNHFQLVVDGKQAIMDF